MKDVRKNGNTGTENAPIEDEIYISDDLMILIKNGMLSEPEVREKIKMAKQAELLAQHPYEIWEGKDGKWRTRVYDESKPEKRRLIKRSTEDELKKYLCKYYQDCLNQRTLWICFDEQVELETKTHTITYASEKKYRNTLKKYFGENAPYEWLGQKGIRNITTGDLDKVFNDIVTKSEIIPTAFRDLKTAVIRVFKYARNEGDTRIEIERYFDELYVPKKAFSKNKKVKQPEGEVFMREEIELLVDFWRKNPTLVRLGLVLASETGVRVGELSACKPEDVVMDGKALFIHRTQTSGPRGEDGRYTIVVEDWTKTENGIRFATLVPEAQETVKKILKLNPDGEYLFESKNGKRIRPKTFNDELKRSCEQLGFSERSMQRLRRMFITEVYQSKGVKESTLLSNVGQGAIAVARKSYLKDNQPIDEKITQLSGVINF